MSRTTDVPAQILAAVRKTPGGLTMNELDQVLAVGVTSRVVREWARRLVKTNELDRTFEYDEARVGRYRYRAKRRGALVEYAL